MATTPTRTGSARTERVRDDPWVLGALALSLATSATFIARSAFRIAGERAFSLFDDAMISMVYARNLADGHGVLYNPGEEAVEGITNPLWTFVMAIVHLVVPNDRFTSLAVMLIAAGLLLVTVVQVRRIALLLDPEATTAARTAAVATALLYPLAYWTLRGMETGLVTVLTLWLVIRVLELERHGQATSRQLATVGAICTAAVWTRLDLAVVTGAVVLWALFAMDGTPRRQLVSAIVAGTGIGGFSQLGWRLATYGEVLPTTWTLKVAHTPFGQRLERGTVGVLRQLQTGFAAVFAAASGALAIDGGLRRRCALPLTVAGTLLLYSAQTGGDAWEWMGYANRFLTPALVLLLPVACVSVAAIIRSPTDTPASRVVLAVGVTVILLGALPLDLELLQYGVSGAQGSVAAQPLALGAVGLLLVVVLLRSTDLARRAGAALTGVAVLLGASVPGLVWATQHGPVSVDTDAMMANHGAYLAAVLTPDANFATVLAGAPRYFSNRNAVDLLGKNDPIVADLEPQEVILHPGHTKWDYDYSILQLRPDAVARLWRFASDFVPDMLAAGYVEVVPKTPELEQLWTAAGNQRLWVRRDSPHVRWDLLDERGE